MGNSSRRAAVAAAVALGGGIGGFLGLGIGGFLGLGIGGNFNLPNMVALNKPTSKLDKFVLTLMGNLKSLEP